MKILHFSPYLKSAGLNRLAADLACALQECNTENLVLAPPCELVSRMQELHVQHARCSKPNILTAIRGKSKLKALIRNFEPDIIQVYSREAAWIAGLSCRRMKNKPPIVGVMTGYPVKGFANVGLNYCDCFTTVSKHLRNVLGEHSERFRKQKQPWVIPYGVNQNQCFPDHKPSQNWMEQWNRSHPGREEAYTLCIPGGISPLHGLDDLVPIMQQLLKNGLPAHAYIAGDVRLATPGYVEHLRNLFSQAQIENRISWIGARTDMRDVMAICNVTLSLAHEPATHDHTILEALALGRPVAGYEHGAVGELLSSFLPDGKIPAADPATMADVLTQWYTYPPVTPASIPYPYRITDTARSYRELYQYITQRSSPFNEH